MHDTPNGLSYSRLPDLPKFIKLNDGKKTQCYYCGGEIGEGCERWVADISNLDDMHLRTTYHGGICLRNEQEDMLNEHYS